MSRLTETTWENCRAKKDEPATRERLHGLILTWEQLRSNYASSRSRLMDQREQALSQVRQLDGMLEQTAASIADLSAEIAIAQEILAEGEGRIDA